MGSDTAGRNAEIDAFLARAGWSDAVRLPLGQDASTRRYIRLVKPDGSRAMLMDAPRIESDPCPPDADDATRIAMGWNASTRLAASRVDAFVLIASYLRHRGFRAPEVIAHDSAHGFALRGLEVNAFMRGAVVAEQFAFLSVTKGHFPFDGAHRECVFDRRRRYRIGGLCESKSCGDNRACAKSGFRCE